MKHVDKVGTLFFYDGKLCETVGIWKGETIVGIKPVRSEDYEKCECGRELPNQWHDYAHTAPLLQEGISEIIYVPKQASEEYKEAE